MDLEALMDVRPTRRENLCEWYATVLEAADCAGTTVAELAELIGCSRETIYSWRRRLRDGAPDAPRHTAGLVHVHVVDREPEQSLDRLEVRTRCGRTVVVPSRFDSSTLAAVVAVLERC